MEYEYTSTRRLTGISTFIPTTGRPTAGISALIPAAGPYVPLYEASLTLTRAADTLFCLEAHRGPARGIFLIVVTALQGLQEYKLIKSQYGGSTSNNCSRVAACWKITLQPDLSRL